MSEKKEPPKEWNGIPREEINWNPMVNDELCIGCGICYINCGSKVYTFDPIKNRPIVSNPLSCKVGCVTCQNTCPSHALSFPSLSYLHLLIKEKKVIQYARNRVKMEMK